MDTLVKRNSTGRFVEFESGGDGIATLIADANFKRKSNIFQGNEPNINGIHGEFYINDGDRCLEMYLDDSLENNNIQIKLFRYEIKKVNNRYELHKHLTLHIVDEFIELSLNSMESQPYYNMIIAAIHKCMDVECITSYYSKEE